MIGNHHVVGSVKAIGILISAMLVATCSVHAQAQQVVTPKHNCVATVTWTGAVDDNWKNKRNWNVNRVPTGADDVSIPIDATITGQSGKSVHTLTIGGNVRFMNDGSVGGYLCVAMSLTVDSGATLTWAASNIDTKGSLMVGFVEALGANITNNGTIIVSSGGIALYDPIRQRDNPLNFTNNGTLIVENATPKEQMGRYDAVVISGKLLNNGKVLLKAGKISADGGIDGNSLNSVELSGQSTQREIRRGQDAYGP